MGPWYPWFRVKVSTHGFGDTTSSRNHHTVIIQKLVIVTPGVDWKYMEIHEHLNTKHIEKTKPSATCLVVFNVLNYSLNYCIHLGHPKLEPVFTQGQLKVSNHLM